jgi:hypothetical protein
LMMLLGTGESLTIQSNKSISASCAVASVERCPFLPGHNLQIIYPWVQRSLSQKIEWLDLCVNRRSCYLISSRRGHICNEKWVQMQRGLVSSPTYLQNNHPCCICLTWNSESTVDLLGGGWQIHCLDQLKL